MIFGGWDPIVRTIVVGTLGYARLVVILRLFGKRTLSEWNAFDLVVTVALGSTLATALVSSDVSFARAATAFVLLALLQVVATWLSVRSRRVETLVNATPVYLVRDGTLCEDALRRERVTVGAVQAAVQHHGIARIQEVWAVVLEADGSFSVIAEMPSGPATAIEDLKSR